MGSFQLVFRTWILLLLSMLSPLVILGSGDCPRPCSCTKSKYGRKVSCSARGITELSIRTLPSDTVEIDLSANEIQVINQTSFQIPRSNKVKKIILRSNKIHEIEAGAFRKFSKLNKLYLEENLLLKIKKDTFSGLKKLKHLNVSTNQLMYIEPGSFRHMNNLRKLSVANNKLVTLTSDPFVGINIRSLQLDGNPLICDCGLKWMVNWIDRNNVAITQASKCEHPKKLKGKKLVELLKQNWDCGRHPFDIPQFQLRPFKDQVAFQNDSLSLHCSTMWHPTAKLQWYKDGKTIPAAQSHAFLRDISDLYTRMNHSILIVNRLVASDSGAYSCRVSIEGTGRVQKKLQVRILAKESKFCSLDIKRTNRGVFVWHNTAAGGSSIVPCQFGGIYVNAFARRNCSISGTWGSIENRDCLHRNKITRNLELLNSYAMNQSNVVQSTRILYSLSNNFTDNLTSVQELQYIINILKSAAKFGYYSSSLRRNVLRILNMLLAINVKLLRTAQFERHLANRLLQVIPLTAQSTLDKKGKFNSIITKNIATHVISFQPENYRGLSCILRFPRGPKRATIFESGEVYCDVAPRSAKLTENLDAAVDFSPKLFSGTNYRKPSLQRNLANITFIAYRDHRFFIETVPLTALTKNKDSSLTSVVIGLRVQVPGTSQSGIVESLTIITFRNTKVGINPRLVYWAQNDKKTGWLRMKSCSLTGKNERFTQFKCNKLPGKMLYLATVMDVEAPPPVKLFQPAIFVFVGSGVCAVALMLSLLIYAAIRELRYNRNDAATTMNLCLALFVAILLFAVGINRVHNDMLCKAVAVLLHYFLLCSLLWLGCGGLCLQSLVVKIKVNEEYNPVLKYYLIGWGLPMIVCGITLAGSAKNYSTEDYCWLYPTASLAAFIGPGALIVLINLIIFVRLHTAINRRFPDSGIDQPPVIMDNKHKKSRLSSIALCSENDDFKFPKKSELLDILRGSLALLLWFCGNVAFAVMMLAYRKQPSSVLYNLFSYGYGIGLIFLGLTVLFFFCFRQEVVQVAVKNLCTSSKTLNTGDMSARDDVLLLSHSPSQGNEILPKPQDQLALLAGNVIKDQSDIVSGISGPPSVFTDAVSSRPSSIQGPIVPFNFEQNAEKIKELAPVSERDFTENEVKSREGSESFRLPEHRTSERRDVSSEILHAADGHAAIRTHERADARFAPIALTDCSSGTLKKTLHSLDYPNTANTNVTVTDNTLSLSDSKVGDVGRTENTTSDLPSTSALSRTSLTAGVDVPSSLKSFVPPNWKPARRGGSGVSYYPYFDHNFHKLPKRVPVTSNCPPQAPIGIPRPVPIPCRGDVQGGPATSSIGTIPIVSCDPIPEHVMESSHQSLMHCPSAGSTECNNSGVIPVTKCLVDKTNSRGDVHGEERMITSFPFSGYRSHQLESGMATKYPNCNMPPSEPIKCMEESTSECNDIAVKKLSIVETNCLNTSGEGERPVASNVTADGENGQGSSVDAFSPTASSQQSDVKDNREMQRAVSSQSYLSRRQRRRRHRRRPSSTSFDEIPVPKSIVYIPVPHVTKKQFEIRAETSV